MNTEKTLLAVMKAHGMNAWIHNGYVYADAHYTKNGHSFMRIERVGKTIAAVKRWLGY